MSQIKGQRVEQGFFYRSKLVYRSRCLALILGYKGGGFVLSGTERAPAIPDSIRGCPPVVRLASGVDYRPEHGEGDPGDRGVAG